MHTPQNDIYNRFVSIVNRIVNPIADISVRQWEGNVFSRVCHSVQKGMGEVLILPLCRAPDPHPLISAGFQPHHPDVFTLVQLGTFL